MIRWLRRLLPTLPIVIETERFVLRAVGRRWLARRSFAWSGDAELLDGLGWPAGPYTAKRWRRNFWRSNKRQILHFAIFPKSGGALIGANGIDFRPDGSAIMYVAIGDRLWWGRGVVTEIRTAILDHAFARPDIHRVYGQVHARNFASVFNYQTLGFVHEGTLRRQRRIGADQYADLLIFGLLKEEWQKRRAPETPTP